MLEEADAAKYIRAGMLIAFGVLDRVVLPSKRNFGVNGIEKGD